MIIKVLTFGIARELCGGSVLSLGVPADMQVGELKAMLTDTYPALSGLTSFAVAVNGANASSQTMITEADELAIIPPVSGG